ncbi:bifunctional DNA primase/polymerase [Streptomyces sp. NPDC008139]|uniref:bifunctional DNA primase/polymerase n=1 Tax=Streptomyces sp. NPDC008139 TaxID=3364814 RepID=UPI0036E77C56
MTHPHPPALLSAALAAAERGWPVIPLHPGAKRPAGHPERSCPRTGRCAAGHLKPEQRATLDPDLIRAAWNARPYNVGIATGPAGLVVLDLDVTKPNEPIGAPDGATSLKALCERAGEVIPATYRVRTARGGEHLYFTAPSGVRLGCTVNRLGPHIDTRAWGGYVVAAGSAIPQGPYAALCDDSVAKLPEWLQNALTAPQGPVAAPIRPMPTVNAPRYATVALERETASVATTGEGSRHSTLLRAVIRTGRFVAWGDLDRTAVEAAFEAAGIAAGLPESDCRTTIRDALDYSLRTVRPREKA